MKSNHHQNGIALLVLIAAMTILTAAVTASALKHLGGTQVTSDKRTASALAQAKEALIGYAITYSDTHNGQVAGYLPCPDINGRDLAGNPAEGVADPSCGSQDISQIGRLPWKTLDLPPLRGGDDECLWYAVSGNYKNNPKTGLMNWDANGQFQIYAADGASLLTPPDNQAVAIVFSPGIASPGQNRAPDMALTCGGNYTAGNYLDTTGVFNNASVSGTARAISQFRIDNSTIRSSDHAIFITMKDIWNAMQRRRSFMATLDAMTRKTAECIASFGTKNKINDLPDLNNKSLPWAAQMTLANYADNTRYNDSDGLLAGHVPYKVNTSRGQSGNMISSPYHLLQADGANCPVPKEWSNLYYPWWDNWKDHLFYAISKDFQPVNQAITNCESCLNLNGSGNYAAVVIFAGIKLAGQNRTDKSLASAYLEGRNAVNISTPNGHRNYQIEAVTRSFNDLVYCIKQDMSIAKGNSLFSPACP